MDVTIENFEEVLREIKPLIDECDFLAIDCEFTGLDEAPATAGKACAHPTGHLSECAR